MLTSTKPVVALRGSSNAPYVRWILVILLGSCISLRAATEVGKIGESSFRIDVPDSWNGSLIVYCHGYDTVAVDMASRPLMPMLRVMVDRGFAVAQAGYSAGGWAVQEAEEETNQLREYFDKHHGKPRSAYLMGHSMGAFVAVTISEKSTASYDGVLALCAPLGPASLFMGRRVFDFRVLFDHYFHNVLPLPNKVAPDFMPTPSLSHEIQTLLEKNPAATAEVLKLTGTRDNGEIIHDALLFTQILADLERRAGGNPFDNRNIIYEGSGDDILLNKTVNRYAADPIAAKFVDEHFALTGRLSAPILAVRTAHDPLVPVWVPNTYASMVEQGGGTNFFAQQVVPGTAHCAIETAVTVRAMESLLEWRRTGKRPVQVPDSQSEGLPMGALR